MPRKKSPSPKYQYHTSGQARVYLDGRHFYLGEHDSPKSYANYHALLAIYPANGMTMPDDAVENIAEAPVTILCLTSEFRSYSKEKYSDNKTRRNRFKNLCTLLEDEYADLPVENFGPRKLAEIRERLVATTNSRGQKNSRRSTKWIDSTPFQAVAPS